MAAARVFKKNLDNWNRSLKTEKPVLLPKSRGKGKLSSVVPVLALRDGAEPEPQPQPQHEAAEPEPEPVDMEVRMEKI